MLCDHSQRKPGAVLVMTTFGPRFVTGSKCCVCGDTSTVETITTAEAGATIGGASGWGPIFETTFEARIALAMKAELDRVSDSIVRWADARVLKYDDATITEACRRVLGLE